MEKEESRDEQSAKPFLFSLSPFPLPCADSSPSGFAQCLVKLCGTHLTSAEVAVFTMSGIDWYNYAIMRLYPASLSSSQRLVFQLDAFFFFFISAAPWFFTPPPVSVTQVSEGLQLESEPFFFYLCISVYRHLHNIDVDRLGFFISLIYLPPAAVCIIFLFFFFSFAYTFMNIFLSSTWTILV